MSSPSPKPPLSPAPRSSPPTPPAQNSSTPVSTNQGSTNQGSTPQDAPTGDLANSREAGPDAGTGDSATVRRWLQVALGAAISWWLILAAMALFSANPVLISQPQFRRAPVIVTADTLKPATSTARVTHVWRGEVPLGEIQVANLQELRSIEPGPYLLLLRRVGPAFVIVKTELQSRDTPPLVYPATPDAIAQIETLLQAAKSTP